MPLKVGQPRPARPAAVVAAPHAPPRIIVMWISSTDIAPNKTISSFITTTTNVASVEARVQALSMNVPRTDFGQFSVTYKVPPLPSFLKRTYDLQVIARNADGVAIVAYVPIRVNW